VWERQGHKTPFEFRSPDLIWHHKHKKETQLLYNLCISLHPSNIMDSSTADRQVAAAVLSKRYEEQLFSQASRHGRGKQQLQSLTFGATPPTTPPSTHTPTLLLLRCSRPRAGHHRLPRQRQNNAAAAPAGGQRVRAGQPHVAPAHAPSLPLHTVSTSAHVPPPPLPLLFA
jgi:hypothetical protein